MERFTKYQPIIVLGVYFVLTHVLYGASYNAGMVTDFSGLIQKLEEGRAIDVLNSFGFPSIQPILNLVYFLQYSLFGLSPLSWYLLFSSLFILNAWMIFLFAFRLSQTYKMPNPFPLAFCSGLLFLSLPYQSEVMVWKVSLSYHLIVLFILFLLYYFLEWAQNPSKNLWWFIQSSYFLALLTFELSYTFPFIVLLLFLALPKSAKGGHTFPSFIKKMWTPLFIQLTAYLLATRLVLGTWIGHYGASVHLGADPFYTIGNFFRYFFKYIFLGRFLSPEWKDWSFQSFSDPKLLILILLFSLITGIYFLFKWKRLKSNHQLSILMLGLFLVALLPVVTLFFNSLLFIENDRYGYLASVFFSIGLVSLLFSFHPVLRYSLLLAFMAVCLWFTWKTNSFWQESTKVYQSLLDKFDFDQYDHVFILNLPDNLNGATLFRDYSGQDRALTDALKYVAGNTPKTQIHEIVQFNLTSYKDKVKVEYPDSNQIKVNFQQYGNWWWRRGLGATNYENDWYKFENKGMHYLLYLKDIPDNSVFIYQDEFDWKIAR